MTNTTVDNVINYVRPDGKTMWIYYKEILDAAAESVAKGQV